jgi:hypothetical protein
MQLKFLPGDTNNEFRIQNPVVRMIKKCDFGV